MSLIILEILMTVLKVIAVVSGIFAVLVIHSALFGPDWKTADMSSAGIAALPEAEPEALVQIYTARAFSWRKYFAVHSWIATKEKGADHYTTYHVIGWNLYREKSAVQVGKDIPDRRWFNAEPTLIYQLKGEKAERAIPNIKKASASYPYAWTYHAYPGPNSNTYISHIIRNTPELVIELPPHALGKDWVKDGFYFGRSETGTGWQFSAYGLFGIVIGKAEGIEINLLALTFGIDFLRPALKLPFVGRIGMSDKALD